MHGIIYSRENNILSEILPFGHRQLTFKGSVKKIAIVALLFFTAYFSLYAGLAFSLLLAGVYIYSCRKSRIPPQTEEKQSDEISAPSTQIEVLEKVAKIHLFKGDEGYKGVSHESVTSLEKSIQDLSSSHVPALCTHEEMDPSNWNKNDLVVFPGGRCSEWNELLSEKKQAEIHDWFKNGGRILGICAGAYYCSQKSSYQLIDRVRQIALFPGECRGPAYSTDLKVVKIKWQKTGEEGYVTVIQGGFFIPDQDISKDFEVLARYTEDPQAGKIAVVSCKKEKGFAILSAPHWEFNHEDLEGLNDAFPLLNIRDQQIKLQSGKDFRQKCISEMFSMLLAG